MADWLWLVTALATATLTVGLLAFRDWLHSRQPHRYHMLVMIDDNGSASYAQERGVADTRAEAERNMDQALADIDAKVHYVVVRDSRRVDVPRREPSKSLGPQ